ncbi:MAG: MarR family transcriptional regulator [Deltaproteobacteria bacterium]|nr:MAG: MarR family transcriptional regulator [Deltaproteobacteria bacterium]
MAGSIHPEDRPDVDAIVETIIYLYTESRRLTKGLARQYGLTGPQLTVVKILESLGHLSLSSLSDRIKARNSTVTGIIDRMERDGLVRRERSETDRRIVLIRLTPKGRKLAEGIEVEPMALFRQALEEMPAQDIKELFRILTQFQQQVRATIASEPRLASVPEIPNNSTQ